ncbi:hypothetical protein BIT28_03360 [Photobacterium proteolyticum]|uniref:Replication protein n=1 Tax=Photobacterium proteolyticum TaxID=1903952 RepID=A0A1Q9GA73_9GAMM|nr:hypothetical protein [Photobacterium proteolyticum]OLQ71217.1 hypothetical protein BIT28_03360 [Photobacterium proteolyticum]
MTLATNDLLYVAGAVQPHDKTEAALSRGFLGSDFQRQNHIGNIKALNSFFASEQVKHEESLPEFDAEHIREAAARSDENNRLVQGRKSPTHPQQAQLDKILLQERKLQRGSCVLDSIESVYNHEALYAITEREGGAKILPFADEATSNAPEVSPASVRLMNREWSGQYKVQYYTQTPASAAPDAVCGERFTEKLTKRAVKNIFESAAYVSACHGGFTTFLTLTFSQEQRCKIFGGMNATATETPIDIQKNMADPVTNIAGPYCDIDFSADDPAATVNILDDGTVKVLNGNREIAGDYTPLCNRPKELYTLTKTAESTIGKEVSRFMDGVKKMYHRGWVADHTVEVDAESGAKFCPLPKVETQIAGYRKAGEFGPTKEPANFHYIWVAECPANDDGEPNPHVHVLLNWSVPQQLFSAWANRIEGIWGNGFAHLERIRESKAAGTYIIKAVGYAAKGDNADQGLIKGNRYNIARCSRAPAWECIASFEADNMAAIIKECGYKLEQWKKPLSRTLHRIEKQLNQTVKARAIAKKAKKPQQEINKLKGRIIRLENQARATRDQMKARCVHASTKNLFCIAFDGEQAGNKAYDFLLWAAGARGWSMSPRTDDTDYLEVLREAKLAAWDRYQHSYHRFREKRAYWHSVLTDPLIPPTEGDPDIELSRSMVLREQYETLQLAA